METAFGVTLDIFDVIGSAAPVQRDLRWHDRAQFLVAMWKKDLERVILGRDPSQTRT